MKGISLILLCAFALALGDEIEEIIIELNANGCPVNFTIHKVLAHDKYCNLFYTCLSGDRVEQRCPDKLVFNIEHEVCDWAINVDCGDKKIYEFAPECEEEKENPGGNNDPSAVYEICAKQDSNGVLVAHENCDKFYICENGSPVVVQCPEGLLYNYNLGICDWPSEVECGDRIAPVLAGLIPDGIDGELLSAYKACGKVGSNGLLLAHDYCNRFYKCAFGVPVAMSCPSGLMYNTELSLCDWPSQVDCLGKPIVEDVIVEGDNEGSVGGHGHSDPSQAPAICAAENSDGVLIAHEVCNQFYKCWNRVPVTLDCPLYLLYNPEVEYCDWPQNVDCGGRTQISRRR